MDNLVFRELLYGLTQSEWVALLGESLGIWLKTVGEGDIPKVDSFCPNIYNKKPLQRLCAPDLLTKSSCYTKRGVEFVRRLYSFRDKKLPLPIAKDPPPKTQLSFDREATFGQIMQAFRLVVSKDEMRPVLNCASVTEEGIVATNGHILFFVGYKTGHESFLYNPVLDKKMEFGVEYPKWREIVWDVKQANKHYNGLVLEIHSRLMLIARLFPDALFGRNIFVKGQRFSIDYFNRIFKIYYEFGLVDCDVFIKDDLQAGMIIKAQSRGFEFLTIVMPIRERKGQSADDVAVHYLFEDFITEQETEGFLGMM